MFCCMCLSALIRVKSCSWFANHHSHQSYSRALHRTAFCNVPLSLQKFLQTDPVRTHWRRQSSCSRGGGCRCPFRSPRRSEFLQTSGSWPSFVQLCESSTRALTCCYHLVVGTHETASLRGTTAGLAPPQPLSPCGTSRKLSKAQRAKDWPSLEASG